MDRVFTHLRCTQCSKCARVFCCVKHRVEHERRVHVSTAFNVAAASAVQTTGPVIKRRFRSTATTAIPIVNSRKRLHHHPVAVTHPISGGLRMLAQQHQQQRLRQQVLHPFTGPMRNVLKATRRRHGVAAIEHARPMAESSPTVAAENGPAAASAENGSAAVSPTTPYTLCVSAVSTISTTVTGTPHDIGTLTVSEVGTPSIYQTPMQTMWISDSVAKPCSVSIATPQTIPFATPQIIPFASPQVSESEVRGGANEIAFGTSNENQVSLGQNTSQKGFFWSNMARRFRLALRPARPKVHRDDMTPTTPLTPAVSVNVAKYYGNIHPRRPINNDLSTSTPVNARPSLDDLRRAHEEANKAMKIMTDSGL